MDCVPDLKGKDKMENKSKHKASIGIAWDHSSLEFA